MAKGVRISTHTGVRPTLNNVTQYMGIKELRSKQVGAILTFVSSKDAFVSLLTSLVV